MRLYSITFLGRPTFYLDADVSGIISKEHAAKVAHCVLGLPCHVPGGEYPDSRIHVEEMTS